MAANFTIPSKGFGKRASLKEQLDRFFDDNDVEDQYAQRLEEIDALQADVEAGRRHRWHAPKTQKREDAHLSLYKQFVLGVVQGRADWEEATEAEWKQELFLLDFDKMVHNMQL